MRKWQYIHIETSDIAIWILDIYGKEGWELVSVVSFGRDADGILSVGYYFKRPIEEA